MIGQQRVQQSVSLWLDRGFPRFSIISGPAGSGKKVLAAEISKNLCYFPTFVFDTSKDMIVQIIEEAYKALDIRVYILCDSDNMSVQTKNSLLKVLEEPPNNAYFILLCENKYLLPPTIRSRGVNFDMDPYSKAELAEYINSLNIDPNAVELILNIADNPGEINAFIDSDVFDLYDFVTLVINNIAEVSGSNAFKIADKLALKKDQDGYDLKLFWKVFNFVCMSERAIKYIDDAPVFTKYGKAVLITDSYLSKLNIKGINLMHLFDNWILDIRKEWL